MSFPPNFPFFLFLGLNVDPSDSVHILKYVDADDFTIIFMYRNPLPNHLHESQDIHKPLPKLHMSSPTLDFKYKYIKY